MLIPTKLFTAWRLGFVIEGDRRKIIALILADNCTHLGG
jgi:hypothetical protein